jgi:hypothetical protein
MPRPLQPQLLSGARQISTPRTLTSSTSRVVHTATDYFDQKTGDLTRIVFVDHFDGALSNPLSGKSVPDRGHARFAIYFAPDGSISRVLEEESEQNPLLPVHAHFQLDADGNVLTDAGHADVGHDYLSFNKHPFSIAPLCAALS